LNWLWLHATRSENLSSQRRFYSQHANQYMFWFDKTVTKSLGRLRSPGQDLLALCSKWDLHGGRNAFASGDPSLDFSANFWLDIDLTRKPFAQPTFP